MGVKIISGEPNIRRFKNIEFTDEFEEWFNSLADKPRKRVTKIIDMLDMMGQGLLGTKYAKSIVGSENLFELVIQVGGNRIESYMV